LPTGGNTMQRYPGATVDRDAVKEGYEQLVRPPPEVLAATFGIIRERRSNLHPDSVTYVFGEPRRNMIGRTVCRGWRVTDHPQASPAPASSSLMGGRPAPVFPGPNPDLKPQIDYVEVSCDDARMEKHVPGSLTTPVPRHP
jgi:hypothetical protein